MKQPVFYLSNRSRRDDFATETLSEDGRTIIKRAVTEPAVKHVERMLATYDILKPLKLRISIARPERSADGTVKFPLLNGRNAENELAETLVSEGPAKAVMFLEKMTAIIEALPSVKINPAQDKDFQTIFAGTYNRRIDCSTIGLVDLNFDNFIIDSSGQWNLIDYEWRFDFAVPKDLLMQRMLFWFFVIRFQKLLLLHSDKYDMVRLAESVYVPTQIFRKYEKHFDNLVELVRAEAGFQRYVHNVSNKDKLFDFDFTASRAAKPDELLEARRNLSALGHLQLLQEQFEIALKVNKELEAHIESIEQSRSYRLARKMQTAKHNLKFKR